MEYFLNQEICIYMVQGVGLFINSKKSDKK